MSEQNKLRIGITMGDINGIGPEVVMKVLSDPRILNLITPVVYGSSRVLAHYKKLLNMEEFQYSQVRNKGQYTPRAVNVVNCWENEIEIKPGQPSREAGNAALMSLKRAVAEIKEGHLDALVTAPIDKNTLHGPQFPFHGHTEFLTKEFEATESLMMMVSGNLKVALVTEHISLREVPPLITAERVELKIRLLEITLKKDFGMSKPRLAVLGLNPHAGDGDLLGKEENEIIKPVVEKLRTGGKIVFGPYPADGFFAAGQHKKFDAVLAMYHDQGLVAFKALAFDTGVNFTAGLPIVRTSPDHGTAYNIVGKNIAEPGSMREAIFLAAEITAKRLSETEFK